MTDIIGAILFFGFLAANVLAVIFMRGRAPDIQERVSRETPAAPKLPLDAIERSLDEGRTLRSQMLRAMLSGKRAA
jgi:hypothetical protein